MRQRWRHIFTVGMSLGLLGCGPESQDVSRRYVTDEYIRKQRDCEARTPQVATRFWGKTDLGPSVQNPHEPMEWRSQRLYLGDTCYFAVAGPYYKIGDRSDKPLSFAIDVEVNVADPSAPAKISSLVLFSRTFGPNELPKDFDRLYIGDIVSFIEADHLVRFQIGSHSHEYRLPAP